MKFQDLPPQADIHKLVFRTLGKDQTTGMLGCGFMRKTGSADSYLHTRFPHFGVVWVLRGTGEFTDSQGRTYPLSAGKMFLRIPGELHSSTVLPDGQWLECFLAFSTPFYRGLDALGRIPHDQRVFSVPLDSQRILAWVKLCQDLDRAETPDYDQLLIECTSLLFALIQEGSSGSETNHLSPSRFDPAALAKGYLEQNLHISPRNIAAQLGVSYSQLRKVFAATYGITMVGFRKGLIIQRAKHLLLYTTESLGTIAHTLGYSDQGYFSRDFKEQTGMSPREFRLTTPRNQSALD